MFLAFKEKLSAYPVFNINDITVYYPKFDRRRLVEWQHKNRIKKLRNSFYCFSDIKLTGPLNYFIANTIYNPSYISLQTALSYYALIPEHAFAYTSISTNKTAKFYNDAGRFIYKNVKPASFYGYQLVTKANLTYKIAEPEKAIIDLIYIDKSLRYPGAIKALRLNPTMLVEKVKPEKLKDYAEHMGSKVVLKHINWLIEHYYA